LSSTEISADEAIRYLHIHDEPEFSIGIFVLPPNTQLPLHDHPGMSVLSRILYGGIKVRSFDFLGPSEPSEEAQSLVQATGFKWAVPREHLDITGPHTTALFPDWGNIHEFTSDDTRGCAIFDILTPPYDASNGRDCTYYGEISLPDKQWQHFIGAAGAAGSIKHGIVSSDSSNSDSSSGENGDGGSDDGGGSSSGIFSAASASTTDERADGTDSLDAPAPAPALPAAPAPVLLEEIYPSDDVEVLSGVYRGPTLREPAGGGD
jgi:hypothetical protein